MRPRGISSKDSNPCQNGSEECGWKVVILESRFSIQSVSCDTPYSAIPRRHPNKMQHPLPCRALGCDWVFFGGPEGGIAAIVCDTLKKHSVTGVLLHLSCDRGSSRVWHNKILDLEGTLIGCGHWHTELPLVKRNIGSLACDCEEQQLCMTQARVGVG